MSGQGRLDVNDIYFLPDCQIRNLAQTSPYCPARELLSACHRPIKNTRGGMKGSHCALFGAVPQLLSLTGYQRAFGRSARPFTALLGHSTAWETKLLYCLLMIRTISHYVARGEKEKGLLVVFPVACILSFFFLTYAFVAPVNVIVSGEMDVALGFFFARSAKSYRVNFFPL